MPLLVHVLTVPLSLRFIQGQPAFMNGRGFEVHVVTSPGLELEAFGRESGASVHAIPMSRRITPMRDVIALLRLCRLFLQLRPDIVHAHTPKGGLLGIVAAWITRVPCRVYTIHGLPFATKTSALRLLLRTTERISCHLATSILAVSKSMRDIALHERLALPAKITVLAAGTSNGIDTQNRFSIPDVDERREARQALGIAENSCVIGFVGRIVRDKGIRELTGAWTLLKADFPGLRLLIAGPEEPQDAPEASVMTQLKSDSRVTLLGYMSDPRTAYCAMDVVTLPSYREGFPSVPLEAAAMGLPVVATSVPGCLDAVIDGYTGRLVQVGSAETLAVALREYVSNPTLRKTHGETGAARVRRLFSQERLWSALAHHYELHRQEAMQKARSGQDSNGV